ncbi:MAG TPA: (d)CMP kinase [Desulfobacterales bacterium]|nr:(d)CMP kinase [Desulfobacterales bacterium]
MPPDQPRRVIVTIDGPAGAGKSSIAKRLAGRLDLLYLESGAFYRAVALMAVRQPQFLRNSQGLEDFLATFQLQVVSKNEGFRLFVAGQDITAGIRDPEVSRIASQVATLRPVRQWVHDRLRQIAGSGGVIAEGRDMGTKVFPEAEVKIFLDASLEVRAHRRWLELQNQGNALRENAILEDIAQRDRRDRERVEDPLSMPPGAHYIDSTAYDLKRVEDICLHLIQPYIKTG